MLISSLQEYPEVGRPALARSRRPHRLPKVNPRLVPRASTDKFGMDADAKEADRYRCVPGRAGALRVPRLDAAEHAAPGLLSRRQHLLGLRPQPGDGRWISHPELAGPAVSNQISAALSRAAGRDLENR